MGMGLRVAAFGRRSSAMTTNDLDKLVTHEIFFKAFKKQHLEVSQKASQEKKSSFLNYEKHI